MRLFIGIGLPDLIAERLASAARRALPAGGGDNRPIRWTRPDEMHVTLSFLGSVETGRLEPIRQSLAEIRSARLHLELSGIGVFANAGILLAKLQPSAALLHLAEKVFLAMESCGFPPEQRPYLPHVTLARIRRRASGKPISLAPSAGADRAFQQRFEARKFRIYESLTRPDGAHYRVLTEFPLE